MQKTTPMKFPAWLLCFAWVVLACFGCGDSGRPAETGNTSKLCIGTPMQVRQTNLLADYSYGIFAMLATHDTLVRFDEAMQALPCLAESWKASPDGRQWTFQLTRKARWHDGVLVTPEDVRFTYEYMAAHHSASAWINDLITDIRIQGSTIVFNLAKPYSRFLINVGFIIRILPRHVWQGVKDPLKPGNAATTLGCGPFVFEGFDVRTNRLSFQRNPAYHGPAPAVDTLVFFTSQTLDALVLSLGRGEMDLFYKYASGFPPPFLPGLSGKPGVQMIQAPSLAVPAALGFNLNKGPAGNPDFRKALAPALDYARISRSLLGKSGQIPSAGFIPPALEFHKPMPALGFSSQESRRRLEALGYRDTDADGILNDASGNNLIVTLLARSDLEGTDALLPILAHNLRQAGIEIRIERADLSTWITRVDQGRFDLILFRTTPWGMVMDAGGGTGYFDSRRKGGGTLANVVDPVFHRLCDRVLETLDPGITKELYHQIQNYYRDHLPALALCWSQNTYPASARWSGLSVNPLEGGIVNRQTFTRLKASSIPAPSP